MFPYENWDLNIKIFEFIWVFFFFKFILLLSTYGRFIILSSKHINIVISFWSILEYFMIVTTTSTRAPVEWWLDSNYHSWDGGPNLWGAIGVMIGDYIYFREVPTLPIIYLTFLFPQFLYSLLLVCLIVSVKDSVQLKYEARVCIYDYDDTLCT